MPNEVLTAKALKPFAEEIQFKVLKTKLERALEEFEPLADGEDYGSQVTALEKIGDALDELEKKEKDASEKLKKHFVLLEKARKSELSGAKEGLRLEASMGKKRGPVKPDEDEGEDEGDGTLESVLKIIKARGDQPEKPLQFVAFKGKPYALAIAKKIGAKHKKAAKEKAGTNINFSGDAIFEAAAYTFVLEEAPPRGLAKQLKVAIFSDCGKNFKVRVRDRANLNVLDDETDAEDGPPPGSVDTSSGANVSELKGKFDANAARNQVTQRLMTLVRSLTYALKQEPDESVRQLELIEREIEAALDLIAGDTTVEPPKAAEEMLQKITEHRDKIKKNLDQLVKEHALKWLKELKPLLGDTAATPKALLHAINNAEQGLKLDRAMLKRLAVKDPELFGQIDKAIELGRAKYKTLFPVRTLTTDPVDPPPANRPTMGTLGEEFGKLVDSSEGAMARGEKPAVSTLVEMVKQIELQLPTNLRQSLKDTYKNWDGVKGHFKTLLKTDAVAAKKFMSDYWWFRRGVVDKLMAELQAKYDFSWASVGSANLESDYDITINSHGTREGKTVYDYEIVAEFNKTISDEFKFQPGTLFDTNLYSSAKVTPPDTSSMTSGQQKTVQDMQAMAVAGQDVGSLMKLRRYMDWEAYAAYQEEVLGGFQDDLKKLTKGTKEYKELAGRLQAAKRQFELADDLYFMSLEKQVLKAGLTPPSSFTPQGQKELLEMAGKLSGDKIMEINNQLYVEAMVGVRELEEQLNSLKEDDIEGRAAIHTKLRDAYADGIFFAAEAYHSEGPFKHIVEARQSSAAKVKNSPEFANLDEQGKKKKINELTEQAIGVLTVPQMMQSFNENLGDLLKDLEHYEHASDLPGMGFYRSSKYFERMCDAMDVIGAKLKGTPFESEFLDLKIGAKTPAEVRSGLGKLVKVRGGSEFEAKEGFDPEKEKEAFCIEEMRKILPNVTTLRDLSKEVLAAGAKVNSVLRKAAAAESMIAGDEREYFKR